MEFKTIFSTFLICILSFACIKAQSGFDNKEELGIVYNKEIFFDLRFHTNGIFSFAYNKAKIKTYYKTNFYQIEFGTLRHPKESRNRNSNISFQNNPGGTYTFGKKNSVFVLRGGFGQKRYFSDKQKRRGVSVGMSYLLGGSLGLTKPYYLDLKVPQDGEEVFVRTPYVEEYAEEFLNVQRIINSSGFTYGWKELGFVPGGHAKVGLHLDFGAKDDVIKALDFGFMLDVFYKKLPIMVSEDNKMAFLNVYLSLQLGKRKY